MKYTLIKGVVVDGTVRRPGEIVEIPEGMVQDLLNRRIIVSGQAFDSPSTTLGTGAQAPVVSDQETVPVTVPVTVEENEGLVPGKKLGPMKRKKNAAAGK